MFSWVVALIVAVPFSSAQLGAPVPQGRLPYSDPLIEPPYPYDLTYSYQTEDGGSSHAQEVGDQYNTKRGSYGYTGPDGIYRQVDYIADADGFRATIRTNEPGMSRFGQAGASIVLNPQGQTGPAVVAPAAVARPVAVPARPIVAAARPVPVLPIAAVRGLPAPAVFPLPAAQPVAAPVPGLPITAVRGPPAPAVFPLPAAQPVAAPVPFAARHVYPRPLVGVAPVELVRSASESKVTVVKNPKLYQPKPYY